MRDAVVAYVEMLATRTVLTLTVLLKMLGIHKGKYFHWKQRMGKENRHTSAQPKQQYLLEWEKQAVIAYAKAHYAENDFFLRDGYRRLCYRMLDENIVAVSPSSVYRILKAQGLLNQWNTAKTSAKGTGFVQPAAVHEHWHTDIKYMNFHGAFLFLISVMDGYSRYIVHHEVRTSMTQYDVELTIERAREKFPNAMPRIITDNGAQFLAKDFREFMKAIELTHIKTSVAYPQSNGKIERYHRTIGAECLRTNSFLSLSDARIKIAKFVEHYNCRRLHSALGYLTPEDLLLGREKEKRAKRAAKLHEATAARKQQWKKLAA